jgi:hypothetical protein
VGGAQHALLTLDVSPPSAVFISIRLLSSAVTAVLASNLSAMPILKPFVAALPDYGRAVAHDRDGVDARRQLQLCRARS